MNTESDYYGDGLHEPVNKEYQRELQGYDIDETILKEAEVEEEVPLTMRNDSAMDTNRFDYTHTKSLLSMATAEPDR